MNDAATVQSQQSQAIAKLQAAGWVIVTPQPVVTDGSVLMSSADGVNNIIVMLDGDRVDARQKLGKNPPVPTPGEP